MVCKFLFFPFLGTFETKLKNSNNILKFENLVFHGEEGYFPHIFLGWYFMGRGGKRLEMADYIRALIWIFFSCE